MREQWRNHQGIQRDNMRRRTTPGGVGERIKKRGRKIWDASNPKHGGGMRDIAKRAARQFDDPSPMQELNAYMDDVIEFGEAKRVTRYITKHRGGNNDQIRLLRSARKKGDYSIEDRVNRAELARYMKSSRTGNESYREGIRNSAKHRNTMAARRNANARR